MTDAAGRVRRGPTLLQDALVTIGTRFGLAVLIFGTDIVLAHLLGPSAKGRFALVLLTSQLAAVVVGWGMDSALGVVSRRDPETARRGFANALIWSIVVGGFAVVLACWAYGLPTDVRPRGPLASVIPSRTSRAASLRPAPDRRAPFRTSAPSERCRRRGSPSHGSQGDRQPCRRG